MQPLIESMRFWASLIVTFWLFGYFSTKVRAGNQYVRVWTWLFYLCGAPKLEGIPKGVLTRQGAGLQIISFLLIIFALCFQSLFSNRYTGGIIGLGSSLFGAFLIVQILLRRSPYV